MRRPVGFFDSGLGGLTVVREFRRLKPRARVIYFGDTAHLPYGNKSARAVKELALADARFMLERGVGLVVAACSTASSVAMDELKRACSAPVLGVVEAGASAVPSGAERVGVIGTQRTVAEGSYRRAIAARLPRCEVVSLATPLLVPLVEEGLVEGELVDGALSRYLPRLGRIDTLVLGCTHYPLLLPAIRRTVGEGVEFVNPSKAAGRLAAANTTEAEEGGVEVYLSDLPEGYDELVQRFLGDEPARLEQVETDA